MFLSGASRNVFMAVSFGCMGSSVLGFSPMSSLYAISSVSSASLSPQGPLGAPRDGFHSNRGPLGSTLKPLGNPLEPLRGPLGAPREGFVQLSSSREAEEEDMGFEGSEAEGAPAGLKGRKGGGAPMDEFGDESQAEGDLEEASETVATKKGGGAAAPSAAAAEEEAASAAAAETPAASEAAAAAVPSPPPLPPLPPASEFLPQLSYADGDELCHSVSCAKVFSGASGSLPVKGCKKAVKCVGCKEGGAAEAKCSLWKPPRQPEVLLRNGSYYGIKRVSRSGSLDLAIKWEHENSEIDFSQCLLDVKQATRASRELKETGNVKAFAFYRVAQLTLAVVRSAEEGGGSSGTPKFAISLKMNDGQGLPRVLSTSGRPLVQPSCFQAEQKSNTVTLGDKEAAFIVGWFSIPKQKAFPLYPRNFTVRLYCHGATDCSLSQLSICARLSCPIASPEIEQEVAAAESAMQNPVGDLPALPAAAAPVAAAAAGGNAALLAAANPVLQQRLLLQQQLMLQQRQNALRQLQFRGRLGFMPAYWRGAAHTPHLGGAVTTLLCVFAAFFPFIF